MTWTPEKLEARWPAIPWREPQPVSHPSGASGLGCRFCIAMNGLRASEIGLLPQTREEFDAHMAEAHP